MNPNLFKSAEFYHRRYHNFATVLILPLVFFVLFLVLFSFIGQKEVTVKSIGEITPMKVIAMIQSTSDNTVLTNHLAENKTVTKGELLVQYTKNMEASQQTAIETQLASYQRQKAELETLKNSLQQGTNLFTDKDEFGYTNTFNNFIKQSEDLTIGISKNNSEVSKQASLTNHTIAAIDEQMNELTKQMNDYHELYHAISSNASNLPKSNPHQATFNLYKNEYNVKPNPSTTNQYLSQINTNISDLKSSIANLKIQKAGTGTAATYDNSLSTKIEVLRTQFIQTADQQLATLITQITDLQNQLNQANVQLQNNRLVAPETGVLHISEKLRGNNLLPKGTEIAQIYPDITKTNEVLITYYVPSAYMTNLKKGQTTRLTLEKIGKQSITIIGNINKIDTSATETKQGNLFKVTAKAKISKSNGPVIKYGLQGRVTIVIAKKSFFNYYKDKLLNNIE
ncbi:bacteriocin secretion accessory protein [Streptococcus anginosus]|uniref:Bacteriocin secretion accessory protein n=1 Tax=Streptococcus anginosus subsp. whileyi CCUG 39159 TaxID=1095729 RepID=I0SB60_STRAP|nr:bacteriocin secretion accessory protein [Streptococcus anginosus]AGU83030.1 putative bacteriocin secretion accessory protein [Streptococcus anginosus C238]EID20613.1 bacteriocin secretion accessory protein [Streptococcus anginosus subsp. whileyi CCUG 39159]MDB8660300.1 bacteriocin secretion accessory protein [Streptococcus anginosus]MDP1384486.1 bacteriocin secretion accessory protein [Streptococcus anginosus]QQT09312.1 bacteriocin secretion accessory protein [Streptococcus anginosus]